MAATSWVRWVVTASRRMDAEAARPSQSSRAAAVGGVTCGLRPAVASSEGADGVGGGSPGGETAEQREDDETGGPDESLGARGEVGFDQEGIAEQRQHGKEVGEGEEAVGQAGLVAARVPGLQQRAGGGEQKVGQADGGGEQREDGEGGLPDGGCFQEGLGMMGSAARLTARSEMWAMACRRGASLFSQCA